ncbi:UNKNOWN [Stylonychia lemnae]|uniref:Cadg domain containing protein n=1 Tax=Stylonychia lemnae TaxID=5949 RepID=A0A077ZW90_STYLE|nr:UNKNOWN [Stylonychia lemnae]|eukprot:CDW72711.1 UNKNOWN [Stylonychia lemnae]
MMLINYSKGESVQCFDYQFPQALGSPTTFDESSLFYTLDVSPSGYIIAGGASNETNIVNSIQTPIMVQYNSKGQLMWAKQIVSGGYQYVSNIRHMNDNYIVAVLSAWGPIPNKVITLALFATNPLTFIKTIVDDNLSHYAFSGADSIIFESDSVFNFVYSDNNGDLILTKFQIDGSKMTLVVSAKYELENSNYKWYPGSITISSSNLYISGQAETTNYYGWLSMFSLSTFSEKFSVSFTGWYSDWFIQKIKYYKDISTGLSYIYGCLGSQQAGLVKIDVTSSSNIKGKWYPTASFVTKTYANSKAFLNRLLTSDTGSNAQTIEKTLGISYSTFDFNTFNPYQKNNTHLYTDSKVMLALADLKISSVLDITPYYSPKKIDMTVPQFVIPDYFIFSDPLSVVIPTFMQTECNDAIIKTSIISNLPIFMTFDGNYKLTISSNDLTKAGSYILKFRQTIQQNSQYLDGQFTFKLINPFYTQIQCGNNQYTLLTVDDLELDSSLFTYEAGTNKLTINSQDLNMNGQSKTLKLNGVETKDNGYISLDEANNQIIIYSASSSAIGTHTVKLQGSLLAYQLSETIQFQVIIKPNNKFAPRFSVDIPWSLTLLAPSKKIIGLPDIIDDDGDSFHVQITYGKTKQFLSYISGAISISALASNVGEYDFSITLTDDNPVPLSQTYKIHLSIILEQASVNTPATTTETNNSTNSSAQNTSSSFILNVNSKVKSDNGKKVSYQTVEKSLKAYISSISMMGEVDIKFSERILDQSESELQNQTALSLKLDSKIQSMKNFIKTWEIISVTNTGIKIQVTFNEPLLKDDLKVEFLKPQYFIAETLKSALPQQYTIKKSVPPQLPNNGKINFDQKYQPRLQHFNHLAHLQAAHQQAQFLQTSFYLLKVSKISQTLTSSLKSICLSQQEYFKATMMVKRIILMMMKFDFMSTIVTTLMGFFILGTPYVTYAFLARNQQMLSQDQFQTKFGTMYMNLKTTEVAVFYPTIFFTRRLLFAVSICFMDEHSALQLTTQIIISMGFMSFIFQQQLMTLLMILFVVVGFTIIANWCNLIYHNAVSILNGIKKFRQKRKLEKNALKYNIYQSSLYNLSTQISNKNSIYIEQPANIKPNSFQSIQKNFNLQPSIDFTIDKTRYSSSELKKDEQQKRLNQEFEIQKSVKKQTNRKKQTEKIRTLQKQYHQIQQSRYNQLDQIINNGSNTSQKQDNIQEKNLKVIDIEESNLAQKQIPFLKKQVQENYNGYDIFRFNEINDEAFQSPFEKSTTIQTKQKSFQRY